MVPETLVYILTHSRVWRMSNRLIAKILLPDVHSSENRINRFGGQALIWNLGYLDIGNLGPWEFRTLRIWDLGNLGFWKFGDLGYLGPSENWNFGSWQFGILPIWDLGKIRI